MASPSSELYTVHAGDTLWGIAKTHLGNPTRWPEIARLNDLENPDQIWVGQKLMLPSHKAKTTQPPHTKEYVVKRGDSLWKIARTELGNGERWKEISQLNQLTSTHLAVSEHLWLPTNGSASAPPPPGSDSKETQFSRPLGGISSAPEPQRSGVRETQTAPNGALNQQGVAQSTDHPIARPTPLWYAVKFEVPNKTMPAPSIPIFLGDWQGKLSLKAEIQIVDQDQKSPLVITPMARKLEYQQKAAHALADVLGYTTIGLEGNKMPPTPILKTGFTYLHNGKNVMSFEVQYIPPTTLKGSIKPDWIKPFSVPFHSHHFVISGRIGFDLELTYVPRRLNPQTVPVTQPVPVRVPTPNPMTVPPITQTPPITTAPPPYPNGSGQSHHGIDWHTVGKDALIGVGIVGLVALCVVAWPVVVGGAAAEGVGAGGLALAGAAAS